MRVSVVDKYLKLVRPDQKLYARWLKNYGTEVQVLKPRKDTMEEFIIAYGESASTFDRTPSWYEFHTGYMSVDSLEFSRPENVTDTDILIFLPDMVIEPGFLVQYKKLGRVYTYQVDTVENYQDYMFRTVLRAIDVVDERGEV